jgi:hypothetical protein
MLKSLKLVFLSPASDNGVLGRFEASKICDGDRDGVAETAGRRRIDRRWGICDDMMSVWVMLRLVLNGVVVSVVCFWYRLEY